MTAYVFAFRFDPSGDEVFFRFPQFPEIITAMPIEEFREATPRRLQEYADDAVVSALQGRISARLDIPDSVDPNVIKSDGFVTLGVQQAMKLELFKLYRANSISMTDFARQIGKSDTASRRLLDLRHQSWTTELEAAIAAFGKRLVHDWDLAVATPVARVDQVSASRRPHP